MFYTYVLKCNDNKLYVGWTDNLKERMNKHEKGNVTSTKCRLPVQLIYYEACADKEKAISREKSLKTGYGRRYLKGRI